MTLLPAADNQTALEVDNLRCWRRNRRGRQGSMTTCAAQQPAPKVLSALLAAHQTRRRPGRLPAAALCCHKRAARQGVCAAGGAPAGGDQGLETPAVAPLTAENKAAHQLVFNAAAHQLARRQLAEFSICPGMTITKTSPVYHVLPAAHQQAAAKKDKH
jgi:hypothetical protein